MGVVGGNIRRFAESHTGGDMHSALPNHLIPALLMTPLFIFSQLSRYTSQSRASLTFSLFRSLNLHVYCPILRFQGRFYVT